MLSETAIDAAEMAGKTVVEPVTTAATDATGLFRLTAPDAGMWTVRLESAGWMPLEAELTPLSRTPSSPTRG